MTTLITINHIYIGLIIGIAVGLAGTGMFRLFRGRKLGKIGIANKALVSDFKRYVKPLKVAIPLIIAALVLWPFFFGYPSTAGYDDFFNRFSILADFDELILFPITLVGYALYHLIKDQAAKLNSKSYLNLIIYENGLGYSSYYWPHGKIEKVVMNLKQIKIHHKKGVLDLHWVGDREDLLKLQDALQDRVMYRFENHA